MRIMIGYLLRNLWEKKGRTFLILLSVSLVAALFFASSAIGTTFTEIIMNRIQQQIGTADLIITAGEHAVSPLLTPQAAVKVPGVGAVMPQRSDSAAFRSSWRSRKTYTVTGVPLADAEKMHLFALADPDAPPSGSAVDTFEGMKAIISKRFASESGLAPGSRFTLELAGGPKRFEVHAVCANGMFTDKGEDLPVVVPVETLAMQQGGRGGAPMLWVAASDKSAPSIAALRESLKQAYPGCEVEQPVDPVLIATELEELTIPFLLMTALVSFMSIFIIYSSFRVIAQERLPVIGTFRSIGATKRMANGILLGESVLYGVLGGGLGILLGQLVLRLLTGIMIATMSSGGLDLSVRFTTGQALTAFLFALALCFFSSLAPILKVSGLPVKDVILNTVEKAGKKGWGRRAAGVVLLVAAFLLPGSDRGPADMILSLSGMCCGLAATILLVPLLTQGLVFVLKHPFSLVFGHVGMLAAKNLRENRNLLNNIVMLAIGISSLLMINTISASVADEVGNVYSRCRYDLSMYCAGMDRSTEQRLIAQDGVSDVLGMYEMYNVEIGGSGRKVGLVQGYGDRTFFDYNDYELSKEAERALDGFNDARNLLLTPSMMKTHHLVTGDMVTLRFSGRDRDYRVVGTISTLMQNGSVAVIPARYMRMDAGMSAYSSFLIRASKDPDALVASLGQVFERQYPYIQTLESQAEQNRTSNEGLFMLLRSFSLLAMGIGVIGIVNNLVVGFIQRQRVFAMMRSVGMAKRQMTVMLLLESFTGGIVGGLIGSGSGLLLLFGCASLLETIDLPVRLTVHPDQIVAMVAGGMAIMLLASVSPVMKGAKMKLVESLKYE